MMPLKTTKEKLPKYDYTPSEPEELEPMLLKERWSLTYEQLEQATGISVRHMMRLKNGHSVASVTTLRACYLIDYRWKHEGCPYNGLQEARAIA